MPLRSHERRGGKAKLEARTVQPCKDKPLKIGTKKAGCGCGNKEQGPLPTG